MMIALRKFWGRVRGQWILLAVIGSIGVWGVYASAQDTGSPELEIMKPGDEGWVRLSTPYDSEIWDEFPIGDDVVLRVEASSGMTRWEPFGVFHNAIVNYPDVETGAFEKRFYRFEQSPRTEADDWKNQILFPNDQFRSAEIGLTVPA